MDIDKLSSLEMVRLINQENRAVEDGIDEALPEIAAAIDMISEAIEGGGHVIYVGCGTSGRLGIIDASECPPTFGVPYDMVQGIIAGGRERMFRAGENAEDKYDDGALAVRENSITRGDVLVGISAAGNAAYVVGAMDEAKKLGAITVGISSNENTKILLIADIPIYTDTGAEVLTGSTRLKAGTAQKIVLNTLTTCAMAKTGKVYENMMINLAPSNEKLKLRVIRITKEILGCTEEEAIARLEENDWVIRRAVEAAK
jgi:N-acetylmuramic acid 6-phosphate etherase